MPKADGSMARFQYYLAQREALETVVVQNIASVLSITGGKVDGNFLEDS
ncbi:MAG: hypothetical protein L3J69_04560 [Desulfobacula sp.]|nr:hypothetical protein [Desulfobacula sp.]